MSKFTPGPWTIDDSNPDGWLDIISENYGKVVGDEGIQNNYFLKANAHLISAAPDMHKVCEGLEKWWRLPNAERTIEAIEPVIRDALEALAKADGK